LSNIKIAVVVPVGKIDNNFKDCYQSILNQTHKANKIIIIFDTIRNDVFDELVLHSNTILASTLTRGQAIARNAGIEIAHDCDFIATMDADDLMHRNRIELSIQILNDYPGLDVYCFTSEYIDRHGKLIDFSLNNNKLLEGEEFLKKFYKRNIIVNSTSLIRRSAIYEVGLYSNINKMVDYDLWLRLILMDKRFIFIPNAVISSRIHENQVSHKKSSNKLIFTILLARIKVGQKLRLKPLNIFASNLIWFIGKFLTEIGLRKSRIKRILIPLGKGD
jgi:glycosyltransferase involved in cell wall biosynthesis